MKNTKSRELVSVPLPAFAQARLIPVRSAMLKFSPLANVVRRMNYLHLLATAKSKSKTLTKDYAAKRYRMMVIGFLVQASRSDAGRVLPLLNQYCGVISSMRSFEGTESVFLTYLFANRGVLENSVLVQAVALWKEFGPPPLLGGGLAFTPICDIRSKALTYFTLKELQDLGKKSFNLMRTKS